MMKSEKTIIEKFIRFFVECVMLATVLFAAFSYFNVSDHEANIGSFEARDFNDGWEMEYNESKSEIVLPMNLDAKKGDTVILRNTLPEDISDGSSMIIRGSMSSIYIYVNGQLKEYYSEKMLDMNTYFIPSAYVVSEQSEEDAGKPVEIHVEFRAIPILNAVKISNGNNAWFGIIRNNLSLTFVAIMVIILGSLLLLSVILMQRTICIGGTLTMLGLIMVDMGIYVLSESAIRQIIFRRPSLSHFFSILSMELLSVLFCLYIDRVQLKKHHKSYVVMEFIASLQLVVNIILNAGGIKEFYETLVYAQFWIAVAIVLTIINTVLDIKSKSIKKYKVTAVGMTLFVILAVFELVAFYINRRHNLGTFICAGLIFLMATNIVQYILDERKAAEVREKKRTQMVVSTIETIASSIDAKDEYTGGHSERVAKYAGILAKEMMDKYDFSEEDVLRIRYIGLLHDIGKIGVDDSVLNKAGKLTDEEFSLMKKHVEIGYELLGNLNDEMDGLSDGIRYHHERYDGKGYPDGLKGEEIPLIARILCLADCYDAMTSNRVYRKRLSDEEVRAEFVRCQGVQFDPKITEIFVSLMDRGIMKPDTVEGMEIRDDGEVPKSSYLENRLQKDLHDENIEIVNPGHVRMMCYIAKLLENKNHKVDIFFVNDVPKDLLKGRDINIVYTCDKNVVALFDRTDEEIASFEDGVKTGGGTLTPIQM